MIEEIHGTSLTGRIEEVDVLVDGTAMKCRANQFLPG
jgi:hypothetical protein